jgi:hypothetical protein
VTEIISLQAVRAARSRRPEGARLDQVVVSMFEAQARLREQHQVLMARVHAGLVALDAAVCDFERLSDHLEQLDGALRVLAGDPDFTRGEDRA